MSWHNELMKWDPQQWNGIRTTKFNSEMVWTPDIYLIEDVSKEMSGQHNYMTPIISQYTGHQMWLIPVLLESSCTFDVKEFPYDYQVHVFLSRIE